MKCWICRTREANSGEHVIKASDLRAHFGKITPVSPVYLHVADRRNIRVQSAKSPKLHTADILCDVCNNKLTQPHDQAWKDFLDYTAKHWPHVKRSRRINLGKIFPGDVHRQGVYLQLFFVKLLGCRIAEHRIPIDTAKFADAILAGVAHPDLYLTFAEIKEVEDQKLVNSTQVHVGRRGENVIGATMIYSIGPLAVKLIYSPIAHSGNPLGKSFHPSHAGKLIKLAQI